MDDLEDFFFEDDGGLAAMRAVPDTLDELEREWIVEGYDEGPKQVESILLPHQAEALSATEPNILMLTAGGAGKTYLGAEYARDKSFEFPDTTGLITAPTYRQLCDVLVPEFVASLNRAGIAPRFSRQDMNIRYTVNGSEALVHARSATRYNDSRGYKYGWMWHDEIRDFNPIALQTYATRLRCRKIPKRARQSLNTTTPNGFDHIHEKWVEKGDPKRQRVIRARTIDNPFIPKAAIDEQLATLDPLMAQQEVYGEIVNIRHGRAYPYFNRDIHVSSDSKYNPNLDLWIACDFNVDPMAWVFVQVVKKAGVIVQWQVVDELAIMNGRIRDAVREVARRYGDHPGRFLVTGDPANPRNHVAENSDWQEMRVAFQASGLSRVHFKPLEGKVFIKDRVAAMNGACLSASGVHRLFLNPKCKELRADMEQMNWNDRRTDLDKSDGSRSHWSDALGYLLVLHQAHVRRTLKAA